MARMNAAPCRIEQALECPGTLRIGGCTSDWAMQDAKLRSTKSTSCCMARNPAVPTSSACSADSHRSADEQGGCSQTTPDG